MLGIDKLAFILEIHDEYSCLTSHEIPRNESNSYAGTVPAVFDAFDVRETNVHEPIRTAREYSTRNHEQK